NPNDLAVNSGCCLNRFRIYVTTEWYVTRATVLTGQQFTGTGTTHKSDYCGRSCSMGTRLDPGRARDTIGAGVDARGPDGLVGARSARNATLLWCLFLLLLLLWAVLLWSAVLPCRTVLLRLLFLLVLLALSRWLLLSLRPLVLLSFWARLWRRLLLWLLRMIL